MTDCGPLNATATCLQNTGNPKHQYIPSPAIFLDRNNKLGKLKTVYMIQTFLTCFSTELQVPLQPSSSLLHPHKKIIKAKKYQF